MAMYMLTALLVCAAGSAMTMKMYHEFPVCCKGTRFLAEAVEPFAEAFDEMMEAEDAELCAQVTEKVADVKARIARAPCPKVDCSQLVDNIENQLTSRDECTRDMNFMRALFDLLDIAYEHARNHKEGKAYRGMVKRIDRVLEADAQRIQWDLPKGDHE